MDLIPPISRVFVLVLKEEQQRKMGVKFTCEFGQVISLVVGSKKGKVQGNMGSEKGGRSNNGNNNTDNNHGKFGRA